MRRGFLAGRSALVALAATCALTACAGIREKRISEAVPHVSGARTPEFRQAMGAFLGSNFVAGNGITTLINGEQIFGAMIGAIRGARKSINLETYVFLEGVIARQFSEALAERARAGVKVNIILDAHGTAQMGAANLAMMRDAGVSVQKYNPLFPLDLWGFNSRTHRKLLIIDGRTGFIGGVGIADEWVENANSPREWRENHYRVTGPVVAQLQGIFRHHWLETRGTLLQGSDYFPRLSPKGPYLAHAFKSSPHIGEINLELMYRLAIASAQESLLIENPYFLPDKRVREALIQAAKRGVEVEIIVPGKFADHKMVRIASLRHWPELLRAGIKIYEYGPSMTHVKLMIVDGIFTSIGSANFDGRSMRLNDEANLDVLDRSFANQHLRLFERDRAQSKAVKLEDTRTLFGFPFRHVLEILSPQF